ncbi:DUF922 domain-containing Zn-dependent protease [Pantanalinema sp. GBBB05]|uniref:DUF922 domain-containing Zn-dependent protease n=1 Tax=Pantanalinema sp. GBBB05 TaxID=2604139 RepID=UPI001DA8739D|nr:DUF922 domain-containing protein [Pantanalinema sp. GBBB05]
MLHSQVLIFSLLTLATSYTSKPSTQTTFVPPSPRLAREYPPVVAVRDAGTSDSRRYILPQPTPVQSSPSSIAPTVTLHYRYYAITGVTASELRSQMSQKGLFEPHEGRRYDARTDWTVQWSYRHRYEGNQCVLQAPKTHVDVTLTYPQWKPPAGTPQSLITEWQQYIVALQHHEEGHQAHGIEAGKAVLWTLSRLPAYSSCQQLNRAANTSAQAVIKQYNQKDLAYDEATKHGYTQGANFPITSTVLR